TRERTSGNLIITSQPIEWESPQDLQSVVIRPFTKKFAFSFLITQFSGKPNDRERYAARCKSFLDAADIATSGQLIDFLTPLDLSMAAQLLQMGEEIGAADVIGSYFDSVAAEYAKLYPGQLFPIAELAKETFVSLTENKPLDWSKYPDVHGLLVKRRILI